MPVVCRCFMRGAPPGDGNVMPVVVGPAGQRQVRNPPLSAAVRLRRMHPHHAAQWRTSGMQQTDVMTAQGCHQLTAKSIHCSLSPPLPLRLELTCTDTEPRVLSREPSPYSSLYFSIRIASSARMPSCLPSAIPVAP